MPIENNNDIPVVKSGDNIVGVTNSDNPTAGNMTAEDNKDAPDIDLGNPILGHTATGMPSAEAASSQMSCPDDKFLVAYAKGLPYGKLRGMINPAFTAD
jgi:hypothetical protein